MSGGNMQQFVSNGVVRDDIEAAKRELVATRQMSQSLKSVAKAIDREAAKFTAPEMKAKFLSKLAVAVSAQVD